MSRVIMRRHATPVGRVSVQRQRALDQRPVGARLVRAFAQHLAECAPAALAGEQAEQVAGDVLERDALREPRLDMRSHRAQQFAAAAQFAAEPGDVEPMQQVGIVVRGAAEHRAVGMREVRSGVRRAWRCRH